MPINDKIIINYKNDKRDWDCLIGFSNNVANLYPQYNAYLAFLIGHELGHAYTAIIDYELFLFTLLITDFKFRNAAGIKISYYDLPHEHLYNKYGKYLSLKLFGQEQLNNNIYNRLYNNISTTPETDYELLNLMPSNDFTKLKHDLVEFSLPYKSYMINHWEHTAEECRKIGQDDITRNIKDFNALFSM